MSRVILKLPENHQIRMILVDQWMKDNNVRFLPSQARKNRFRAVVASADPDGLITFKSGRTLLIPQLSSFHRLSNARGFI